MTAIESPQQKLDRFESVIRLQMAEIDRLRAELERLQGLLSANKHSSNRHPVDELADVRAQIKTLCIEEAELRAIVLTGECGLAGDEYVAVVQTRPRNGIDLLALKKHFGTALKPFFTAREITQVWLQVRTQPRETQI